MTRPELFRGNLAEEKYLLKDTAGHSIPGLEDQDIRWMEHFNNLLNRPPPPPEDPPDIELAEYGLDIQHLSIEEIEGAIKTQKSDYIPQNRHKDGFTPYL